MVRKTEGFVTPVFRFLTAVVITALLVLESVDGTGQIRTRATITETSLKRSEALLQQLARTPQDAIPDAVLNRTQCLIVFPENGVEGVASCRQAPQTWYPPTAVILTGVRPGKGTDLLLFLLGSSAPKMLETGALDLSSTVPGPLVGSGSLIAPVELRSDALGYAHVGRQLKGFALRGRVKREKGRYWAAVQARQYSSALVSFFNVIQPTGIIIHHTATIPAKGKVPASKSEVDQYHQARGFGVLCAGKEYHVAYHYLVLPDGKIEQGRPEHCEGAHAPGYNSYLGISVAGDFSSADNPHGARGPASPTAAQIKSLIELCRKLRRQYGIPLQHVLRHSDVSPTECPGDRFPFRDLVSQLARAR